MWSILTLILFSSSPSDCSGKYFASRVVPAVFISFLVRSENCAVESLIFCQRVIQCQLMLTLHYCGFARLEPANGKYEELIKAAGHVTLVGTSRNPWKSRLNFTKERVRVILRKVSLVVVHSLLELSSSPSNGSRTLKVLWKWQFHENISICVSLHHSFSWLNLKTWEQNKSSKKFDRITWTYHFF